MTTVTWYSLLRNLQRNTCQSFAVHVLWKRRHVWSQHNDYTLLLLSFRRWLCNHRWRCDIAAISECHPRASVSSCESDPEEKSSKQNGDTKKLKKKTYICKIIGIKFLPLGVEFLQLFFNCNQILTFKVVVTLISKPGLAWENMLASLSLSDLIFRSLDGKRNMYLPIVYCIKRRNGWKAREKSHTVGYEFWPDWLEHRSFF